MWSPAAAISSARLACPLTPDVGEFEVVSRGHSDGAFERHRPGGPVAVQQADRIGERRRGEHAEPVDGERLAGVRHGDHQGADSLAQAGVAELVKAQKFGPAGARDLYDRVGLVSSEAELPHVRWSGLTAGLWGRSGGFAGTRAYPRVRGSFSRRRATHSHSLSAP